MGETPKSNLKQNWVPTEGAFRKLLEWLDEGADSDGGRYLEMRRRLVSYFGHKQCIPVDELADETLNRVARRLEEQGWIDDSAPAHYCYIIAKYVFLEHVRQVRRIHVAESEIGSMAARDQQTMGNSDVSQKLLTCLEHCLEKLLPGERDLILEYYRGEQGDKIQRRRQLAERLAMTLNALSIRACRIRDRLELCVEKCAQS
jgi:DNA-directed RNA polymerase specialized sigma24 family protein